MNRNYPGPCGGWLDAAPGFSKITLAAAFSVQGIFCRISPTNWQTLYTGNGSGSLVLLPITLAQYLANLAAGNPGVPANSYLPYKNGCCDSGIEFIFGAIGSWGNFTETAVNTGSSGSSTTCTNTLTGTMCSLSGSMSLAASWNGTTGALQFALGINVNGPGGNCYDWAPFNSWIIGETGLTLDDLTSGVVVSHTDSTPLPTCTKSNEVLDQDNGTSSLTVSVE